MPAGFIVARAGTCTQERQKICIIDISRVESTLFDIVSKVLFYLLRSINVVGKVR